MTGFRWGFANVALTLRWASPYREEGLFPQVKILDSDGDVDSTVNLSANSNLAHVYENTWTPTAEGDYDAIYIVYPTAADRTNGTNAREDLSSGDEAIRIKRIPTDVRPMLSGGGAELKEIKKAIKDVIVDFWKYKLNNNKTAEDTLVSRSDFDVEKDIVKTNIKIPKFSTKDLKDFITREISESVSDTNRNMALLIKKRLEPSAKLLNQVIEFVKPISELSSKISGFKTDIGKLNVSIKSNSQISTNLKAKVSGITNNLDKLQSITGQVNNLLLGVNQINSNVKGLNLSKVVKSLRSELDNFNALLQLTFDEINKSQKMIDGLDQKEKERIFILLDAMQKMASQLINNISKTNMVNIHNGLQSFIKARTKIRNINEL
jgi:hypothetical protein